MTASTGRKNQETLPRGRDSLQTFQEWKGIMKTSTNQARNFRPAISKIVIALAVASVMGGMAITPALGANRQGHQDKGWHKGQSQGDRGRREYRPVYQHPQPVYAPPPVYYTPQPSPGISLFFPLDFLRR